MKLSSLRCLILLAAVILIAREVPALAHRVNVFAYAEGDKVFVECSYSKSKKVNGGAITVSDAGTGEALLTGKTDAEGLFSFTVPDAAKKRGADLKITLVAGEGHQNDWLVAAREYGGGKGPESAKAGEPVAATATQSSQPAENTVSSSGALEGRFACDKDAIALAVEAAVEKKIAPLRRMLVEEKEAGPGMTEIVGGVGWIFGLVGVAAYFKSRKS